MEIQLNLEAHQAIKNLTQAGIDEEQATVLVSTFGNFSNSIATKDDLEVVKQGLTQEMNAMDARQSQRSDYLVKTLTQQMKDMEARRSQQMKDMDARQSQRNDSLEKTLIREIAKSRYVMFAAGAGGALIMLGLYEALGRFLN